MIFDLHRLRLLRELEERGTLGAVASALAFSPSAVSQQLAVLEREVGTALFEKAGRNVRLTEAGRLLADHARALLAAADAAAVELAGLGGEVRGTVRAGGLQSVTRRLLVPAVAQLRTRHPRVRWEVAELELEQALPELRLGAMDIAISDEYDGHPRPRPAGLSCESVHDEPLHLVLAPDHPLAAGSGPIAPAALRDQQWVTSPEGTGHHAMVVGTCRALGGYEPDVRHQATDADIQLALVRSAGAIALLPALTLPTHDPTLAFRSIAGARLHRRLLAYTREGPRSPALTAFLAAVGEHLDDLRTVQGHSG
ncbi:LysR family transcriptional regulator [Nakamurella deserti]|uniref:LysR family transcriptional regulator n=1 Tax=Nakamurella deserti TaxID=2164074 RepID=UPI000DBE3A76|nr:LysR family transcriptional regulator [Nakamurella deserti]